MYSFFSFLAPVQFEYKPNSAAVKVGSRVLLHCRAKGYPPPMITWYKGNQTHRGKEIKVNVTTLEFIKSVSNDSGIYTCIAYNIINHIEAKAELQVMEKIKFLTKPPSRITGHITQSLSLDCQGWSGVVAPDISWLREDGQEIDKHRVSPNGTLVILVTSKADATRYTCTAKNAIASINTTVDLHVYVRSCSEWKVAGERVSGYYSIDPDGPGGEREFTIFCDMESKGNVGVTVLSHDSETRTIVEGYANPGKVKRRTNRPTDNHTDMYTTVR